jgi:hypothetical protein
MVDNPQTRRIFMIGFAKHLSDQEVEQAVNPWVIAFARTTLREIAQDCA